MINFHKSFFLLLSQKEKHKTDLEMHRKSIKKSTFLQNQKSSILKFSLVRPANIFPLLAWMACTVFPSKSIQTRLPPLTLITLTTSIFEAAIPAFSRALEITTLGSGHLSKAGPRITETSITSPVSPVLQALKDLVPIVISSILAWIHFLENSSWHRMIPRFLCHSEPKRKHFSSKILRHKFWSASIIKDHFVYF